MSAELNLRFPDKDHVIARFGEDDSGLLPFVNPISSQYLRDIQWYIETYGAYSLSDPDDAEAARLVQQLPMWGKALFNAVFHAPEAQRRLQQLRQSEAGARLITISAELPAIGALPWELLHDPLAREGVHLVHQQPNISIRRRVAIATSDDRPLAVAPKERIHLLFVVSRPTGAGFLDARGDAAGVLDGLEAHAPGRVTCEFLRPATLDALAQRLSDVAQPGVDILHFDGHGAFDRQGGLPERTRQPTLASPANTGYLLFENPSGRIHFVPASELGTHLRRGQVVLVVLSACQSAAVAQDEEGERPMGSVAAQLTARGIPAVLAMTHSVLVHTTRQLFGEFYEKLGQGRRMGESLDHARRCLSENPKKYEVQRGPKRKWLDLHDWFLPVLYQASDDVPLLTDHSGAARTAAPPSAEMFGEWVERATSPFSAATCRRKPRQAGSLPQQASGLFHPKGILQTRSKSNLPAAPPTGFFGRQRSLWEIERGFAGPTRRITLTGFGGQGKTALALEAGRWLTRTGLFRTAAFVDCSRVHARDALAVALSTLGSVLGESLSDTCAAVALLEHTSTLIILDHLETIDPLAELLKAAVLWSEAGGSRVLCTTRRMDSAHSQYFAENSLTHRRIHLDGLGSRGVPHDALEWFAELMKLPPTPTHSPPQRESLIQLFDRVRFHPLSLRVLAQRLKTCRPAELGERLEHLFAQPPLQPLASTTDVEDGRRMRQMQDEAAAALLASLQLSVDRLDAAARQFLPRLAVFQGGAMESKLLSVSGIPESVWPGLRAQWEAAALIEAEQLPGVFVPFIRFHPALAPWLWPQLAPDERDALSATHRRRYDSFARYLYTEHDRQPSATRSIALRELPNLLHAAHGTLDANEPEGVEFAYCLNLLLRFFGLNQEAEALIAKSQKAASTTGSRESYLVQSGYAEQLLSMGRAAEAAQIYETLLQQMGDAPTYERALNLEQLGVCCAATGRCDRAAQHARAALEVLAKLEPTRPVSYRHGVALSTLAHALWQLGRYDEARTHYEAALQRMKDWGDVRSQAGILAQLGTLALDAGNPAEAVQRYRAALPSFQQLHDASNEAVAWHQLGWACERMGNEEDAERHYREAARLKEEQGLILGPNGATTTWNRLAALNQSAGRFGAAELWYRKALDASFADRLNRARALTNLAWLLQLQPDRLAEAQRLAEEALAIKETLDPGITELWNTLHVLALIADQEAVADPVRKEVCNTQARDYRRRARITQHNFPGTQRQLESFATLIRAVVNGCAGNPEACAEARKFQEELRRSGSDSAVLAEAIGRIIAGERDEDSLCAALSPDAAMIVMAILGGLSVGDCRAAEDYEPNFGS